VGRLSVADFDACGVRWRQANRVAGDQPCDEGLFCCRDHTSYPRRASPGRRDANTRASAISWAPTRLPVARSIARAKNNRTRWHERVEACRARWNMVIRDISSRTWTISTPHSAQDVADFANACALAHGVDDERHQMPRAALSLRAYTQPLPS